MEDSHIPQIELSLIPPGIAFQFVNVVLHFLEFFTFSKTY